MSVVYVSHAAAAMSDIERATAKALEIIGGKAETYAKQLCPVDTGRLRNSITHAQVDEKTEAVGTNVEYAPYVELGHHTSGGNLVAARPFLRPAAENHQEEYMNVFKTCMAEIGQP